MNSTREFLFPEDHRIVLHIPCCIGSTIDNGHNGITHMRGHMVVRKDSGRAVDSEIAVATSMFPQCSNFRVFGVSLDLILPLALS